MPPPAKGKKKFALFRFLSWKALEISKVFLSVPNPPKKHTENPPLFYYYIHILMLSN